MTGSTIRTRAIGSLDHREFRHGNDAAVPETQKEYGKTMLWDAPADGPLGNLT